MKRSASSSMKDDYNENNKSQSMLWDHAKQYFRKVLADESNDETSSKCSSSTATYCVAEFGCATGGNSVMPLRFVADNLFLLSNSNKNTDTTSSQCTTESLGALEVLLIDRPENNWNIVTSTVTPESISSSRIFISMIGRCFYEQCTMINSIDLSYSFAATHWMKSQPPPPITTGGGCMFPTCPVNNQNPNSIKIWREYAQNDLYEFTKARYRELKVGGHFIGNFGSLEEELNNDNNLSSPPPSSTPWSRIGKLVYDQGMKRKASTTTSSNNDASSSSSSASIPFICDGLVLPISFRTRKEILDGFRKDDGWLIEKCDYFMTNDPIKDSYLLKSQTNNHNHHHNNHHNSEQNNIEYATLIMKSWKAACIPTLIESYILENTNANTNTNTNINGNGNDNGKVPSASSKRRKYDDAVSTNTNTSVTANAAVFSSSVIREEVESFWDEVCDECIEIIAKSKCPEQYNLAIPSYFVMAKKIF
jgi:hypothetical protein